MDFERFDRASALCDSGETEESMREFEALALQATNDDERGLAIHYQANSALLLGRVKEARKLWLRATTMGTGPFSDALDARLCIAEGRSEEAVQKLTTFLRTYVELRSPGNWNAYADAQRDLGRLLFNLERFPEALGPLNGALELAEEGDRRKEICFYLGVCHYFDGKLEEAETKLIESLPADRSDQWWVHAQFYLGCVYYKQRSYLKARWSFEASLSFIDDSDTELKEKVLKWLAAIPL